MNISIFSFEIGQQFLCMSHETEALVYPPLPSLKHGDLISPQPPPPEDYGYQIPPPEWQRFQAQLHKTAMWVLITHHKIG